MYFSLYFILNTSSNASGTRKALNARRTSDLILLNSSIEWRFAWSPTNTFTSTSEGLNAFFISSKLLGSDYARETKCPVPPASTNLY